MSIREGCCGANTQRCCKVVRLYGQVKNDCGCPLPRVLLKLVQVIGSDECVSCQGIAHTTSDCEGFYQFDLYYYEGNECYKVIVNEICGGLERIIE